MKKSNLFSFWLQISNKFLNPANMLAYLLNQLIFFNILFFFRVKCTLFIPN